MVVVNKKYAVRWPGFFGALVMLLLLFQFIALPVVDAFPLVDVDTENNHSCCAEAQSCEMCDIACCMALVFYAHSVEFSAGVDPIDSVAIVYFPGHSSPPIPPPIVV